MKTSLLESIAGGATMGSARTAGWAESLPELVTVTVRSNVPGAPVVKLMLAARVADVRVPPKTVQS
jgi:hypothetical protein